MKSEPNTITAKSRVPAYEKIIIGPLCVIGEMLTGGHYIEVLRLAKQMQTSPPSTYPQIHSALVKESGVLGAFYRGMFPWGLIQSVKGLPVLFIQGETKHHLNKYTRLTNEIIEPLAGVAGGIAQAFFVCPTQKLKVLAVAEPRFAKMKAMEVVRRVVKEQGVRGLYDGIEAMAARRGMDWMIRFTVSAKLNEFIRSFKDDPTEQLLLPELMACGIVGGAFSAITHPIDCIITNSQKPSYTGKKDPLTVAKSIYKEAGWKGFGRGLAPKILDNSYHTMWMYGIGTFVYEVVGKWTRGD
ncbi:hypothetical protein TrST_g13389 [Triparma strigata]|uniref:Mitochondrial carrier protein n=1 Tax=Triparma strigata TaxID=1606541 RepID=A0A9W7BST4_9STRA|nr:hypothetical protein TrST_g13389 [Triparma strigata]